MFDGQNQSGGANMDGHVSRHRVAEAQNGGAPLTETEEARLQKQLSEGAAISYNNARETGDPTIITKEQETLQQRIRFIQEVIHAINGVNLLADIQQISAKQPDGSTEKKWTEDLMQGVQDGALSAPSDRDVYTRSLREYLATLLTQAEQLPKSQ